MIMKTHKPLGELEWYVIYTNIKCERRALAGLRARGVAAYLPEVTTRRKPRQGRKMVETVRAVFPRYLFAGVDRAAGQTLDQARRCDGVEGVLSFGLEGPALQVSAREIRRVINTVADMARLSAPAPKISLQVGDNVLLMSGPFAGFDAKICAYAKAARRARVDIGMAGGAVKVTVPVDALSKRAYG